MIGPWKLNPADLPSPFGILSTEECLDRFEKNTPKFHDSQKDVPLLKTLNGYGFDTVNTEAFKNVWILPSIITYSKTCQKPILDSGGGFGRLASCILEQSSSIVILNQHKLQIST